MAAGGGHWIKSPYAYSAGASAFMPKALTIEGENVSLGEFSVKPNKENLGYGLYYKNKLLTKNLNKQAGIATMTVLKATGLDSPKALKKNLDKAYGSTIKTVNEKKLAYANPTKIYNSFLDELLTFSPTAVAQMKETGKTPSTGLFED